MANPSSFTLNVGTNALALKMMDMAFSASAGISGADVKLRLSNTSPAGTDTYSTVTTNEVTGNGYATMAMTIGAAAYDGGQTRFEAAATATPSVTASGGAIEFQYAYLTVDDAYVWGHWSWAAEQTVADGNTFEFPTLQATLGAQGVTVNS